ncbi:hypothetical protein [Sulfitobacter sp.]|uniref:hypothetical protein n=1 Tax=Sulfitobacter sp. TaxID=1903071 RepID=UPI003EF3E375
MFFSSLVLRCLCTFGFLAMAMPAAANQAVHIICETKNPSSRDWVPDAVIVRIDARTLNAAVYDEYTKEVFNGPAIAEFSRPTANRLNLKWKLIGVQDSQRRKQNVDFKMNVNMKRMTFTYNGLGESFFTTPGSASGRCIAVK